MKTKVGEERNRHVRRVRESGSVLVELAMVTPIMALLLAGLLHFGTTMRADQVVTNASRCGARRGTQSGSSSSNMETAARNYATTMGLDSNKVTVSSTVGSATADSSCTVAYSFTSPVQSFIDNLLTHPIQGGTGRNGWWQASAATPRTLTAVTVMRY